MFGMMVITNAGAALVRQAASGSKKLVFTRAKSGSQWEEGCVKLRGVTEIMLESIEGRGMMSVDFHEYPTYEDE